MAMDQSGRMMADLADVVTASHLVAADAASDRIVPLNPAPSASGAGKWPGLLERVRGAAHYIRAVEDRAQDYEQRVQALLEQVRADMQEADAKVRAAEQRVREIQAQSEAQVRAAQERARLAEERAGTAEAWLHRISEAIDSEFVIEPAPPRAAGAVNA
jgi:hypothetical protein